MTDDRLRMINDASFVSHKGTKYQKGHKDIRAFFVFLVLLCAFV